MRDVAVAAGVSRATVSLVLRNAKSISVSTRDRVLEAVRDLHYRPNPLVSALMSFRSQRKQIERHTVLAYITAHPAPANSWRDVSAYAAMFEGARACALSLGYRLEDFWLRAPDMNPKRLAQMLAARGIHGAIINPLPGGERMLDLDLRDLAVVGLGMSVTHPVVERVSNDNYQAAMLAIEHCRALGYKRIGFVVSREGSERLEHRYLAALTLAQHGMTAAERVDPLIPPHLSDIPAYLPPWLKKERPDVVIFTEFREARAWEIPRKIGIVDLVVTDAHSRTTGVFQDLQQLGAVAVEHLVARVQRNQVGPIPGPRIQLLSGTWVPGETAMGPGTLRPVGL